MTNEELLCKLQQDIRLRGLSPATVAEYLLAVNTFIRFYDNQSIFDMPEPEIRNYLIYLLEVKKLTPASINIRNSALRFLYGFTLQRNLNYRSIPRQKIIRKLPDIMTVEEIFKWHDYKENNKWKIMTITADEFIRRFLTHVLPHGFMKIRHYGLLSSIIIKNFIK